tara:strand:+ start:225 stop:401 length:177 start_codon:yes stop_codon:yes gene_type:complete
MSSHSHRLSTHYGSNDLFSQIIWNDVKTYMRCTSGQLGPLGNPRTLNLTPVQHAAAGS